MRMSTTLRNPSLLVPTDTEDFSSLWRSLEEFCVRLLGRPKFTLRLPLTSLGCFPVDKATGGERGEDDMLKLKPNPSLAQLGTCFTRGWHLLRPLALSRTATRTLDRACRRGREDLMHSPSCGLEQTPLFPFFSCRR